MWIMWNVSVSSNSMCSPDSWIWCISWFWTDNNQDELSENTRNWAKNLLDVGKQFQIVPLLCQISRSELMIFCRTELSLGVKTQMKYWSQDVTNNDSISSSQVDQQILWFDILMWNTFSFVVSLSRGQTTTEEATEETTTVVTEAPTTTENPANFPKNGEVELLVEDLLHSGYMMHWSSNQGYLVMADIWGQRYIRWE